MEPEDSSRNSKELHLLNHTIPVHVTTLCFPQIQVCVVRPPSREYAN